VWVRGGVRARRCASAAVARNGGDGGAAVVSGRRAGKGEGEGRGHDGRTRARQQGRARRRGAGAARGVYGGEWRRQ
jgi:hypothetical protein